MIRHPTVAIGDGFMRMRGHGLTLTPGIAIADQPPNPNPESPRLLESQFPAPHVHQFSALPFSAPLSTLVPAPHPSPKISLSPEAPPTARTARCPADRKTST